MKTLQIILILLVTTINTSAKTITDMAGRSVDIPDNVEKILPYDAKTTILLFPVACDKMVAKALLPGSKKNRLIANEYNDLPEVDIKNIEEVMASHPQVIIAGSYLSTDSYEKFGKMQKRTNIPVILIDLSIDKLDKTYLFLGRLFGAEQKCSECADFLKSLYWRTNALIAENPLKDISIYYTIGGSGLMTDPSGSKHTEILDYMKINNAAKVPIPTGGHAKVNMEQVVVWNPDYIFAAGFKGDKNAYPSITNDSKWKSINAVKSGNVYKVPSVPFGWFDHPPTINRIPGIIWLSEIFYGQSPETTKAKIKEFNKLFYKYELSEEEYNTLFK